MVAYYSENNAYAAQWLRNLIAEGLIAAGDVDTRSIVDVRADDVRQYDQCHFFAGIGGWSRALRLAGWADDRAVWTGSCPCQPFSNAGKRQGFADERHLWPVWRDLIREQRPAVVFGEQVASAADWIRLVRGDLEAMDYAVGILAIEAASAGAFHLRDRFWFVGAAGNGGVGDTSGERLPFPKFEALRRTWWRKQRRAVGQSSLPIGDMADAKGTGRETWSGDGLRDEPQPIAGSASCGDNQVDMADAEDQRRSDGDGRSMRWPAEQSERCGAWVVGIDQKIRPVKSGIRLLAHGVPKRVDKLRALGNAIVPQVAAQFIAAYMEAGSR